MQKAQKGTVHNHDDRAVDELEFDLNQLQKARPELTPENVDADGLEIVNE